MAPADTCELTVLIPREVKEWLDIEAAKVGQSVEVFATESLIDAFLKPVLTEGERGERVLSERDSKLFCDWLDKGHEPNEALRRLFERHAGAKAGG